MPANLIILEKEDVVIPELKGRLSLYLYIAPFIACPLLILVVAIAIAPTMWFARRAQVPYLMTIGYGASLHNTSCEIAIYGDSTAMIGIYPEIIAQRTGMSTCNIAENEGTTTINDTLVLNQFLQNNPRPRFIVFLYAPEDLDPQSQRFDPAITLFEGITYRFRQPHRLVSLFALMRRPSDVLDWADHCVRLAVEGLHAEPLPWETRNIRYKALGRLPFRMAPLTSCDYQSRATPPDKAWVRSLRSRYNNRGTRVLVDSMALPDCDPDLNYFRRNLSGVIDNQVETLPVSDYYVGGRHVNLVGGLPLSDMVAEQILKLSGPAIGKDIR